MAGSTLMASPAKSSASYKQKSLYDCVCNQLTAQIGADKTIKVEFVLHISQTHREDTANLDRDHS